MLRFKQNQHKAIVEDQLITKYINDSLNIAYDIQYDETKYALRFNNTDAYDTWLWIFVVVLPSGPYSEGRVTGVETPQNSL